MRTPIMNAATSVLFLQKLVDTSPNQPILLLWDRATWHQGPAIQQFLVDHPTLEIFFFRVPFGRGSPALNPQEHVWKEARAQVSHNHTVKKLAPWPHSLKLICSLALFLVLYLNCTIIRLFVPCLFKLSISWVSLVTFLVFKPLNAVQLTNSTLGSLPYYVGARPYKSESKSNISHQYIRRRLLNNRHYRK